MNKRKHVFPVLTVMLFSASVGNVCVAQTLETETARPLAAGWWKIGTAYEFQTSSDGREAAAPFLAEYGLTDNLELVLEPVPFTTIRPHLSRPATGQGDFEMTLVYRFKQETRLVPALAVAAEVKLPTARQDLIGTEQTDYTAYVIASKRLGHFDTHANLAYTVLGSPPGARLNNIFGYALAVVYHPNTRYEIFGEVLGNTSSGPEGETGDTGSGTAIVPEAAGGELVGTVGVGKYIRPNLLLFMAVSYDNNQALQIRPGLTFRFPTSRASEGAAAK
jgi:hypothetical protein